MLCVCGRFVSADWLAKWADSDPELTSIDNSSLQCPHGKLLPNKPAGLPSTSCFLGTHLCSSHTCDAFRELLCHVGKRKESTGLPAESDSCSFGFKWLDHAFSSLSVRCRAVATSG